MVAASKTLQIKLTQLELTSGKTQSIQDTGNAKRIERHLEGLKCIVTAVDNAKRDVEEIKVENGSDSESVREWCDQIEAKIGLAFVEISRLRGWMAESKEKTEEKSRKQKVDFQKDFSK